MKVIEFFGVPGSGKTTYSQRLIRQLKEKGNKVLIYGDYKQYNYKKLILKALTHRAGRSFCLHMLLLVFKNRLLTKADVLKRGIYCLSFIGFYLSNKGKGYIVMDEGVVQGAVSALYTYNKRPVDFRGLVKALSKLSGRYVFIDISPQEASSRISLRNTPGHGRLDDIGDVDERIGIITHQSENFRDFYNALTPQSKVKRIQQ
ncbi:MAG: AAA family ATPase [Lachnospiraceae bacterium]|nr:AAA family ATPase [Lachnospiraceae bacterium]